MGHLVIFKKLYIRVVILFSEPIAGPYELVCLLWPFSLGILCKLSSLEKRKETPQRHSWVEFMILRLKNVLCFLSFLLGWVGPSYSKRFMSFACDCGWLYLTVPYPHPFQRHALWHDASHILGIAYLPITPHSFIVMLVIVPLKQHRRWQRAEPSW